MKKLLFVTYYYIEKEYPLKTKFNGQIAGLRKLGFEVWYLGIKEDGIYLLHKDTSTLVLKMKDFDLSKKINKLIYFRLAKALVITLNNQSFDYIYMRNMNKAPQFFSFARRAKKSNTKLIVEIPTHPVKPELKLDKRLLSPILIFIKSILGRLFSRYVFFYTVIGDPIDGFYLKRPALNIINGIDVSQIPLRRKTETADINLLAVASMSQWHGYDRLIEGLSNYKKSSGKENITFNLVGPDNDGSIEKWKRLVAAYELEEHVYFHGPLYGEDLDLMFEKATIGIGCLGSHRKNLKAASSLKVKEYVARSLPFICDVSEISIPSDREWCMQVDESDDAIDINQIINFANKISKLGKPLELEMRQFALENFSWEQQFKKVFDVIG